MKRKAKAETIITVSPSGSDRWAGTLAEPNARKTNGPLKTLRAAQRVARRLKREGPVRIVLRGGIYFQRAPLVFKPGDGGLAESAKGRAGDSAGQPVVWQAYPGETPVISGGKRIDGWRVETLNGRPVWVATLPAVARGTWRFRQLWVNGRRAARTRLPKTGFYRITRIPGATFTGSWPVAVFKGQDQFGFRDGDIRPWHNLDDVEFVALHFWIETRRQLRAVDLKRRLATLDSPSRMRLSDDGSRDGATYYLANVREALDEPGQWYLDRPAGKLYYLPRRGETLDDLEVIAPVLSDVVRIEGAEASGGNAGRTVDCLHFEGITFSHCEWQPDDEAIRHATPQASCHVPGAVLVQNGNHVIFRRCAVTHVGGYGMGLTAGSRNVRLLHCTVSDSGAGGIKIWHGCRRNTVADCDIGDGGHLYHSGVGVLVGKSSGNKLIHNHVHDFDYSGFSIGWTWGYAEGEAYGNIIEYNHVHHIGRGMLSDMGGIYTLGVSPGTRIRHNIFHDIEARGYGGWAIYTDEGSTDILIENNLSYRSKHAGFHQHYGRDNMVRNNIFAFGGTAQIQRTRPETHNSFFFRHNLLVFDQEGEVLAGNWSGGKADIDFNLYCHLGGKPLTFDKRSFKQWQRAGYDRHSRIADPGFVDPVNADFRLKPNSPAASIGFRPFDLSTAGPRPVARGKRPRR